MFRPDTRFVHSLEARQRRLFARLTLLWGVFALFASAVASAAPRPPERVLYTIAIGQNQAPAALAEQGGLATLRYADDDAVQIYSLLRPASREAFLLTVADADTQARFPGIAQHAVPPSLADLENTIEHVNRAMQLDRAAGREPVLVFFFSGHGAHDASGHAALALFDGTLTQSWLYEKLLERLPARYIHLIIDACHAGAVVRSRDVDATLEPLNEAAVASYVEESTLARFPHVGAILASTASTQSFEWDAYRGGVFAHELISGLRGAADVNVDGRIEYSELSAFFSAANLQVDDQRARLDVVVQPPRSDARAPVFEHTGAGGEFRLVGRGDGVWANAFYVESESGTRLIDVFPEKGAHLRLWLPTSERLYLVQGDQEVLLSATAGTELALASLKPRPVPNRSRGALESSLRRGLFSTRFGPAFYLGYTSQRPGLLPVPFGAEPEERPAPPAAAAAQKSAPQPDSASGPAAWRKPVGTGLLIGSATAAVVSVVFAGLALDAHADYDGTDYEKPANEARNNFNRYQAVAWTSGGAALVFGGAGALVLLWPEPDAHRPKKSAEGLSITPGGIKFTGRF